VRRYTVQHDYRAETDGRLFGPWVAGDEVQLADDDAAWVGRSSPGVLKLTRARKTRGSDGKPTGGGTDPNGGSAAGGDPDDADDEPGGEPPPG